jgi:LEA14-like dessication related protein
MRPIKSVPPGLRRFSLILFFLLCSMPLLAGCTGTSHLPWENQKNLTVALADIELREVKALETIFLLKLRISNADNTPVEIRSLKCDLKINGATFASGMSDKRQGLPQFGTIMVPMVVYTSKFAIVGSVIEILQKDVQQYGGKPSDPLNYELNGKLHLGKAGKDVFPFKVAGKITLNR